MKETQQLANRIRGVILNGKWIANTNMKEQIIDLNWEKATSKVHNFNTIAALTFHIHYYIAGITQVLEGGTLDIRDKYSFDLPPITSQKDWQCLINKLCIDTERMASLVEQLPLTKLDAIFEKEQYGNYRQNINGMLEHSYYHLGQIVLINKLLNTQILNKQ